MNKDIVLKWLLVAYRHSLTEYKKAMSGFKLWVRTQEPNKTRYIV